VTRSVPDGVEVVQTADDATDGAPLLVIDAVTRYLDAEGLGEGALSWQRIGEGQSNVTYLLARGGERFVLRRGPRPPLPPSAHDMAREARIQRAVGAAGVSVPSILAVCTDESVLGVPFYIMSHVEGEVITSRTPAQFDHPDARRRLSEAAVDQLVALHRLDVSSGELAALGRPSGYLERQVERFAGLWDANTTRSIPEVAIIAEWLRDNMPESQTAAVVHGDFRLGNLMFCPDSPQVAAVLDWEMATLGDPLADLGYLTATYAEKGSVATPLELTPVTRERGYLDRSGLVARYGERMRLDLSPLPWYQTLALWKAAIFSEAIYTRWLRGERPGDTFGPTLEAGIPTLLREASAFAGICR
jgi:aminoglycoside phosphotransferase (APT) family kinase protein